MNKQISSLVCIALMCGLLAADVHAQTEEDALRFTQRFPATGARMIGMGGAGVAGVADFSAMFYNPAGLAYFNQSVVSGSLGTLASRDDALYRTPDLHSGLVTDVRTTGIENLGYLYRVPTVRGSLLVGVTFNQVSSFDRNLQFESDNASSSITDHFLPYDQEFEIREDEDGFLFPRFFADRPEIAYNAGAIEFLFEEVDEGRYPFYQAVHPATTIRQAGDVSDSGRMSELNVGGAVEAAPGVMAGLSANFSFGRYRYDMRFTEWDAYRENHPDDYIVIWDDGTILRGFERVRVNERFTSEFFGFSMRGGVSGTVTPNLRAGVALESPTFFTVNEDYSTEVEMTFQEGGVRRYGGQTGDVGTGRFEYRIRSPWRLSGGLAFIEDNFTVSGDVEVVDWTQMRLDASTNRAYFDDVNRRIRDDLDLVVNVRLGGEYRLQDLSLRAGIAHYPDPRRWEMDMDDGTSDRARNFFSAGVGYRFANQLQVDLGWMQERFNDQFVPYTEVERPPVVDESVIRNRVSFGVTFTF